MLHGYRLNNGYFLTKQLDKVVRTQKGVVVIDGLITLIALALGIDPYGVEQARGSLRLNIELRVAMKMIVHEGDMYCLTFHNSNFNLPLSN